MGIVRWSFALTIAVLLLPVVMPFIAGMIANILGCTLHEGGVTPCRVGPLDIGGLLYTLFVTGWHALVTLPAAAVVAVMWVIAETGVHLFG